MHRWPCHPAGRHLSRRHRGRAGHSKKIAARATSTGRLIAGPGPRRRGRRVAAPGRGLPATVVQSNFRYADRALAQLGVDRLDGVLLDLGFSSPAGRGLPRLFVSGRRAAGHAHDKGGPAADLVNTASRGIVPYPSRNTASHAWQIAGKIESARRRRRCRRRRSWCRPSPRRCRPRCAARD